MASHADIPPLDAMLCEHCGYNLTGLPAEGRCPECGDAISDSISSASRRPTAWEAKPSLSSWMSTRHEVLWHPSRFTRRMLARQGQLRSRGFALIERSLASFGFASAVSLHLAWLRVVRSSYWGVPFAVRYLALASLILLGFWLLSWATVRLTVWEAAYRGLRLPRVAVERGLHYHSVHYTATAIVLIGLQLSLVRFATGPAGETLYVYCLCGFVVVAAGYLFVTYWAIMRKLLHANF